MTNQSTNSSPPSNTVEWRVIAPLCLTVFVGIVHATAIGPLAVQIADSLGVSVPMVGQVQTLALATLAIAGFFAGPLADYYGHRRAILTGLITMASGALVMALAPTYLVLLLGGILAGLGASMTFGVCFAAAANRYTGDAQRQSLSRIQAFQSTGSVLGAPLMTAIAAIAIWRASYLTVIGVYAVILLLVSRGLPRDSTSTTESISFSKIVQAYTPLLRSRTMVRLYAASFFRALAWVGPFLYLGAFMTKQHGLSLGQVGLVYMVSSGAVILGNLTAGGRLGAFDLRLIFCVTTLVLGAGWAIIYALPLSTTYTIVTLAFAAFAGGVSWIALTTTLAAESPAGKGTTMVLNISIFGLGSSLSAGVGGLVIGMSGYQLLGLCFPAFALVAGLLPILPIVSSRTKSVPNPEEQLA